MLTEEVTYSWGVKYLLLVYILPALPLTGVKISGGITLASVLRVSLVGKKSGVLRFCGLIAFQFSIDIVKWILIFAHFLRK